MKIVFFYFIYWLNCVDAFRILDPDELVNTTELIKNRGYLCEEHEVKTQDGYILNIQRIPHQGPIKSVVFLQHGLLDASSTFAMNFRNQSLAYVLADLGYDVWLGNMRGNTYGLKHESLNKSDEKFWDFSFDEMSDYDLTSMVDYALKVTNQTQLIYIGHSQGTMILFAQLSKNQEFASKIKLFIAMGPVAHLGAIESPMKYFALFGNSTNQQVWFKTFGKKMFLTSSEFLKWFGDKCNDPTTNKDICENILTFLCGPTQSLNNTRMAVYLTHTPAGTSVKNMVHFAQLVMTNKFQMYDYATAEENMKHYNQTIPPVYDITKVKVPTALYWSENDFLADPTDIKFLQKSLPNIVDDFNIKSYNHLDFVWAYNTKEQFYDRMVALMSKY